MTQVLPTLLVTLRSPAPRQHNGTTSNNNQSTPWFRKRVKGRDRSRQGTHPVGADGGKVILKLGVATERDVVDRFAVVLPNAR